MLSENIRVWRLEAGIRKATLDNPLSGAYQVRSFGDAPRILAGHVLGSGSLDAKSCVVLAEADTDVKRTREVCRAEYQGFGWNRSPMLSVNAYGDRFVAFIDGSATAFRVDGSGMHQLWKVQRIQSNGSLPCLLHPTLDLIWTGQSVLDFSTGREKVSLKLNGFKGISTSFNKNDVIWVGADRVLQVGYWGKSEKDEGATSSPALEKSLVLWDVNSGEACLTVPAPRASALCVSPDGTMVAEAGEDKRVRIRDAKTLSVLQEFRVHDNAVSDVAWHPTLPMLATQSWEDHSVRVWNLKDYRMLEEFTGLQEQGRMTISPNGRRLLVTEKKTVVFEPKSFDAQ
jgi:WD40 repeat protein